LLEITEGTANLKTKRGNSETRRGIGCYEFLNYT
jgi:hypothetical protein